MGNPVGMGQSYTFRIRVSYIPTSTELVLYRGQLGERTNPAESEKERARRAVVGGWMVGRIVLRWLKLLSQCGLFGSSAWNFIRGTGPFSRVRAVSYHHRNLLS